VIIVTVLESWLSISLSISFWVPSRSFDALAAAAS
jgi:hypothetical protein